MPGLVTIAIPVYKRLNYLPGALAAVRAQDYPQIELIVSDNGVNGAELPALVERHFGRGFRFRQNPQTVSISTHFNQLLEAARGEYFVLLADDDEISPNFVSALVSRMENSPQVGIALSRVETMDQEGRPLPMTAQPPPPSLMGWRDFIGRWSRSEHEFVSFATNMSRTAEVRAAGGYLDFPSGNGNDNALVVKLALGRSVAYCTETVFRYRVYEVSTGLAASAATLAEASRQFMRFLDADADIRRFARGEPQAWAEARAQLIYMTWMTYYARWKTMYRARMTRREWVRAGFAFPWVPAYYRAMLGTLAYETPLLAPLLALRRRRLRQA